MVPAGSRLGQTTDMTVLPEVLSTRLSPLPDGDRPAFAFQRAPRTGAFLASWQRFRCH